MLNEFKDFIAKGNVMDLAVGIIIGAAFTAIVSSLVNDLINPVIGLILGGIDFTSMYIVLSGNVAEGVGLDAARVLLGVGLEHVHDAFAGDGADGGALARERGHDGI